MKKLPEGWEYKDLKSIVVDTQLGINVKSSVDNEGIPLLKMGNLTIGGFDLSKIEKTNEEIESIEPYYLQYGDFLFNTRNTPELVGKSAVWKWRDKKVIFNSNIMRLTFKDNIDSFFLGYYFSSNKGWTKLKSISTGTTSVGAIYTKDLLKVKIPIPPLEEQKKIAEILSTVDQKIDFVDKQIEETETLKKGLMQKLLTQGIGHSEFKDSEIGRIPKSWKVKRLEETCSKIVGGGTPSKNIPEYWNSGVIPWVTPSEFTKSESNYISESENRITEEGLKNSSATLLSPGTVIMSSRAIIGECKINTIEITTNQGFISFEPNELLNNLYLLYILKQNKEKIIKLSSGSTFLEVSRTTMKNFKIPIPSFEEQNKIVEILSTIDKKLEILKVKKKSFEELKKGLMQKLLTGEVRV